MKLENGYKLIYEVVKDGVREFRASKTGIPAEGDYPLTSNTIGANKLVYEYNGKLYGTGNKFIPTYDENGVPTDTALISDEAFAEVFIAKEPEEAGNEPDATNEEPVSPAAEVTEPADESNEKPEEPEEPEVKSEVDPEDEE